MNEAIQSKTLGRDLISGLVVYLVALPLCLGIALASGAPMAAGLLAGIVGGIVVGSLSGSQTSVSGPAAGLAAVVATQITSLGSFSAFLVAVALAGVMQIGMGLASAGFIAAFFPSAVIKGLLAAIGVILVLKQLPHVFGHDADAEGEMAFSQPDGQNSFTEIIATFFDIQPGAAAIGLGSIGLLWVWGRIKALKNSLLPGPLVVVLFGVAANALLQALGSQWVVNGEHLVQVPSVGSLAQATDLLVFPDWSALQNPAIYLAAFTLAIVASLETLLNLDAVDQIDPQQRKSPPNRELFAQGTGNLVSGLLGGLPITSVIVRSSVNINSGGQTKLSAILHGFLLLASVLMIPELLNTIPLSALAAILFMTGLKLATPQLFRQMWSEGRAQFLPFIATVAVIVLTDLLTGVLVGLFVATMFILWSNFSRPLRQNLEQHLSGDVLRIELASQVSFFNRPSLSKLLHEVPRGRHVLLDGRNTNHIDPDILDLLDDFRTKTAPAHGVDVSFLGFHDKYPQFSDEINFIDYADKPLQTASVPDDVIRILEQGNERFLRGEQLTRDLKRQMQATAAGQSPLAVVLSCIDSRTPAEHIFDLGLGDIFSVRVAGNVAREKVLGSIEYGCKVAGARLVVVMGHTACGAVTSSVALKLDGKSALEATGCDNLDVLVDEIQKAVVPPPSRLVDRTSGAFAEYVDRMAARNVQRTLDTIRVRSGTLARLLEEGRIDIIGAMYDVRTGKVEFLQETRASLSAPPPALDRAPAGSTDSPA